MIKIWLIRHGATDGNRLGRYIGRRTDEPLSVKGRMHIQDLTYPISDGLFVSPMLRCRETAAILFPNQSQQIIPDLAECDFGQFENKNYQDLAGNANYQAWIDSNGELPFPGGESKADFRSRCVQGLNEVLTMCLEKQWETASLVIHGGTIMHLMDAFAEPSRDFYGWHVKNGGGYQVAVEFSGQKESPTFRMLQSFLEG